MIDMAAGEWVEPLRKALGLTLDKLAERSAKKLDRSRLVRVTSGRDRLSTVQVREGLALAFGLPREAVDALIDGKMTWESALQIVKRNAPEVASPISVEEQGERLAVLTQLRHLEGASFPNLELCVMFYERSGKRWSPPTIASARAGHFGPRDLTPIAWADALDGLEAALARARTTTLPGSR